MKRCIDAQGMPEGPDHCNCPGMHGTVCLLELGQECYELERNEALSENMTNAHHEREAKE